MNEREFIELSAGAALHALSAEEQAAFDEALAQHPEWAVHVDLDARAATALADGVAEVAPPLTLRSSLLAQIAASEARASSPEGVDAAAPADAEVPAGDADTAAPAPESAQVAGPPTTTTIQTVARRNWTRGLFALAASLVMLVVLGFGAVSINELVNRPAAVIALEQIESAPDAQEATVELTDGGVATAHWSESLGQAVLVGAGLPQLSDDETFEMWFVRSDGTPVSAGLFTATDGQATALLDGELEDGDIIAVSVEPSGGSPSGAPSSDPIVAIPTTA
jgi:anti-sigma-K factor RskA